jgi:sec-independent protein translocase protein TatA
VDLLGPWHLLLIAAIFVVLFGAKRLPEAARSLGKSARILKTELKDVRDEGKSEPVHPVHPVETVESVQPVATVHPVHAAAPVPAVQPVPTVIMTAEPVTLPEADLSNGTAAHRS